MMSSSTATDFVTPSSVTVKLNYRTYRPYGWFAFKFCHIYFSGYNYSYWERLAKDAYAVETHDYEERSRKAFDRYSAAKEKYEELSERFDKRPFLWFCNSEWCRIKKELDAAEDEYHDSDEAYSAVRDTRQASDDVIFYQGWLRRNGFMLVSESKTDECPETIEIWARTDGEKPRR